MTMTSEQMVARRKAATNRMREYRSNNLERFAEYNARRRGRPQKPISSEARQRYQERFNAKVNDRLSNRRVGPWSEAEDAIVVRADISSVEKCFMLQRTYSQVKNRQYMLEGRGGYGKRNGRREDRERQVRVAHYRVEERQHRAAVREWLDAERKHNKSVVRAERLATADIRRRAKYRKDSDRINARRRERRRDPSIRARMNEVQRLNRELRREEINRRNRENYDPIKNAEACRRYREKTREARAAQAAARKAQRIAATAARKQTPEYQAEQKAKRHAYYLANREKFIKKAVEAKKRRREAMQVPSC